MRGIKLKLTAIAAGLLLGLAGTAMAAAPVPSPAMDQAKLSGELEALGGVVQPIGVPNDAYAKYFTGKSYISNLSSDPNLPVFNVTFVNGAHTFWHVHNKTCQVLIAQSGRGYYQIWGQQPKELLPGMTVTIPAGVKHWHGAAPGVSFQHIALMQQVEGITTDWLEPVDEKTFEALP